MTDDMPPRIWAWGAETLGEWDVDPSEGTEYVRADLFAAVKFDRDRLRAEVDILRNRFKPETGQ